MILLLLIQIVNFLSEAIKLKTQEYIVKPIDVKFIGLLNELASNLYQEILVKQQQEELKRYKEILDSNNIVIKTDLHLKITYVNEFFVKYQDIWWRINWKRT